MKDSTICFYHKSDLDGVCSGAIVKNNIPNCTLYGIAYNDEFPWHKVTKNQTIYMVDFSLPPIEMDKLNKMSQLIWIDHHLTAINSCDPKIKGLRDNSYAACELTWKWFSLNRPTLQKMNGKEEKLLDLNPVIKLLGRYDIWDDHNEDWRYNILPFQYGFRSLPDAYVPESKFWQFKILESKNKIELQFFIQNRIEIGREILAFQSNQTEHIAKNGAFELFIEINGDNTTKWWLSIPKISSQLPTNKFVGFLTQQDEKKTRYNAAICFT